MTVSDYWEGDPWLYAAHRESRRLQDEARAWDRWSMGLYVYEAIARTSPLINPFHKTHRADPWVDKPYEVTARESKDPEVAEAEAHERTREWLMSIKVDRKDE